jgi:D-alanyl-D-alanine dipeptidase
MYVANPKQGSRHNRGCAVDVSLYSLATGEPVAMISNFDDMSQRANIYYRGGTYEQQVIKYLLIKVMNEEGFMAFSKEWWHFDYKGWKRYEILDIPFSDL